MPGCGGAPRRIRIGRRTRLTQTELAAGGAAVTTNADAFDLLHRDVANVGDWFNRRGIAVDVEAVYAELLPMA